MFKGKRVMVIAPHQDDEVLGCGGLIQKVDKGSLRIVFGTVLGEDRSNKKFDVSKGEYVDYGGGTRLEETLECYRKLRGEELEIRSLAEGDKHHELDSIARKKLVGKIEKEILDFDPEVVLVPSPSYDQDHEALYNACMTATRPHFFKGSVVKYEIGVSQEEFEPNFYLSLTSEEVNRKQEGFMSYASQDRGGQVASAEGIVLKARLSGLEAGLDFAERYEIVRINWRSELDG